MRRITFTGQPNFYLLSALVAVLIAVCVQPAFAQESRGSIEGRVLDKTGAVVPNVAVEATNVATNVSIKTTSNSEGNYVISFVVPGVYKVGASAAGFKTVQTENIELRIHDRLQVDLNLEVGSASEKIQVTGEAPLLETANANLGQVIDSRRISELPLPHGSPFTLMYLTPGVVNVYPGGEGYQQPTNLNATTSLVNINGAPLGTTDWTVDGTPNTQTSNTNGGMGMANSPPADMVQEFKLETAFDASVGHTSGAIVNLTLKTGTNQPHGTINWFHRSPGWDANDFFSNRAGLPAGNFYYNRWGGTFLGPLYIPKVYDGRNRTFFSYGYEGLHFGYPDEYDYAVPTPEQLTGDFSKLLALSSDYQIYDPATIRPAGDGRFSRLPFAGNIIPTSRISALSSNIAQHFAKPNATGTADGSNNFTSANRPDLTAYYDHMFRIDHQISDKQRFYARVTVARKLDGPYRDFTDDEAYANIYIGKTRQFAVDDVYTFSPSFLMDIRYGYSRFAGGHFPRMVGYDISKLGFSSQAVSQLSLTDKLFPCIEPAGIIWVGCEGHEVSNNDIHTLFVSFTKQHGNHNMKFGMDLGAYRDNDHGFGYAAGDYIFGTNFTQGPFDNSSSSPGAIGQGLASFLLGQPTGGIVDRNDSQAIQSTYWSFYFHDNWRVSRRLTLDVGLRWEYEGPVTERFNRSVRGFDPNASLSVAAAAMAQYALHPDSSLPVNQFRVQGGLMYAGVSGSPSRLWDRTFGSFAPRFGFAYQAKSKLVVRGGFGIYPIQIGQPALNRAIQTGYSQTTNLVPTLNNGQDFIANLENPFPNGVLSATGASLGANTYLGNSVQFYNPTARTPYNMQWSLNTQFLLPGQVLLETGYRGSKAVKLQIWRDMDGLPNQYLSRSPVRDQTTIDYLTENIPNPFAGLVPGTSLNSETIPRSQLLLPYPQFSGVTMLDFQGYSWYHALQFRLERRFSKGFTTLVGYTFSKTMGATEYLNPGDPTPYRTILSYDRPHNLTFSGIFELPFGQGKTFARNVNRIGNAVIGGWELASIWHFNSGFPLSFGNALFNGNFNDIALPRGERTVDRWFNTDAGFVRASSQQLAYNLRTFPLYLSGVRSDTYNLWDLSLLKNTKIWERYEIQFRAEFLNALNHPAFARPRTDETRSTFGKIFGDYGLPRNIQLGLKLVF